MQKVDQEVDPEADPEVAQEVHPDDLFPGEPIDTHTVEQPENIVLDQDLDPDPQ